MLESSEKSIARHRVRPLVRGKQAQCLRGTSLRGAEGQGILPLDP